jgi:MraZ protein
MFSGEFAYSMDDKGRVCLPAECTDELGDTVMVCRGLDGQVNVYPQDTWQKNLQRLGRESWADKSVRNASRIAFSANRCEVDRQSRILIPPWLREHAALDTNVVILGMNDHLEVWSPERWSAILGQIGGERSDLGDQLSDVGLRL